MDANDLAAVLVACGVLAVALFAVWMHGYSIGMIDGREAKKHEGSGNAHNIR